MSVIRSSWVVIAVLSLCACSSEEFSVHFTSSEISLRAPRGGSALDSATTIRAIGDGPVPSALYIGATIAGEGLQSSVQVTLDQVSRTADILVLPDTFLPEGSYGGTLSLLACKDPACRDSFPGSPHQVRYHVQIVSAQDAPDSPSQPPVRLTVPETLVGGAVPLDVPATTHATVTYVDSNGWLLVSPGATNLTVRADASALRAGTYHATLYLGTTGQPTTIEVTLDVTPALVVGPDTTVTLTGASTAEDTKGALAVHTADGVPLSSWTATSDTDWLVIDRPAGAPGDSVAWHLYAPEVSALDNVSDHTAHITVTAGALAPATAAVTLVKQLPDITNVDRLALVPGKAGAVMVYGSGFSTLAHPRTDLHVTGATPTAVTVLSDRALSVAMPALPAGEYMISLGNALGFESRQKPLSVLAPVDRVHQEIAAEGGKLSLTWDAISQSAYVVNASLDLVMRFDLSHTPTTITAQSIASVVALGMPVDRSVLLVGDTAGTLRDLDPFDLSTIRTRSTGGHFAISEAPIPVTGDNLAWISAQGRAYSLDRSAPSTVTEQSTTVGCDFCAASPDGRRMVFNQDAYSFPSPPLMWWDAAEGVPHAYTTSSVAVFYQAPSDHAGNRWILDFRVFDFNFAVQGIVDVPDGWTAIRYALSRNGRRAYVFAIAEGAIGTYDEPDPHVFPKIFVFDTTGPLITTTNYPLVGSFDTAAYASCLATQGPVACSPYSLAFRITDDDRTLLAVGDRRFLVIPIPAAFQSP